MKKWFPFFSLLMWAGASFAAVQSTEPVPSRQTALMEQFVQMTPADYAAATGVKLTLGERLKLKAAQTMVRHQLRSSSIPQGLYIVLAIFGLAWIAMGVMDNWSGTNWWLNLILTFLFWLPGLIHALIVMGDYY